MSDSSLERDPLNPGPGDPTGEFIPRDTPALPERIGEFRILREIGRGGMGIVYEAIQESLGRHVALKVLPAGALREPQRLERFRREARAAALLHHTSIVPVFGTGEAGGLSFYAMQFIAGQSLDGVVEELRQLQGATSAGPRRSTLSGITTALYTGHSISPDEQSLSASSAPAGDTSGAFTQGGPAYWRSVARLGVQAAGALAYAHAHGVLHRDIKPSNLLLDPRGTLWVTDFGLAKLAGEEDLTGSGDIVGTLRYLAPERFRGQCDERADIYALGLTLYELLTLKPAFDETSREKLIAQVTRAEPVRPSRRNPRVPRDLETIVLKAIAREPGARYQSASELAEDLRCFAEDRPIQARRASPVERLWRWARRNPVVAGLTTALITVLVGTAVGAGLAALSFRDLADREKAAGDEAREKGEKIAADLERLNRANGLFESGLRHAVRKDWARALADYTEATQLRPDNSQVWSDRGVLHLRLGLADEAAGDFEQLFRVRLPNEPAWWTFHAALRFHIGDRAGYQAVARQMRQHFLEPTSPEVVRALATVSTLAPEGCLDPATLVRLVDETAERFPTEDFSPQLIASRFRAGSHREVATLTAPVNPSKEKALRISDLCYRAMSLNHLGEKVPARVSLDAAREKLDATASVLSLQSFGPGQADRYVGSYPPAEKQETLANWIHDVLLFREASALVGGKAEEHPLPLFLRARGCAAVGRWDQADDATARAMQVCLGDEKALRIPAVALVERARLHAVRGHWDEVAKDLDRASQLAPATSPVSDQAVKLYAAFGRDADARRKLDEAVTRTPTNLDLRLQRGRTSLRLADWDEAAKDLVAILDDPRWVPRPRFRRGVGGSFGGGFFDSYFPLEGEERTVPVASPLTESRKNVIEELARHDELYRRVIQSRPADTALLQERGRFLLQSKRWAEAASHYTEFAAQPRAARTTEESLSLIASDVAPWDEVFEPLAQRWPKSVSLWRARATWLQRKGDQEKAADALLTTLPGQPEDPNATLAAEYRPIVTDDELFRIAAARRPDDRLLWLNRFRQRAQAGDWPAAESAAREVARLHPEKPLVLLEVSLALSGGSRFEAALPPLQQALQLRKDDVQTHLAMMSLCCKLKRWDEAAQAFEAARKILNKPGTVAMSIPTLYSHLPRNVEALEQLCLRRPQDDLLWVQQANLLQERGRTEDAIAAFRKVTELTRDNLDAWLEVIRGNLNLKKWEQASQALDQALAQAAPPGKPGWSASTLFSRLVLSPEALEELSRRRPEDVELLLRGAQVLGNRGKWDEALPILEKADRLAKDRPDVTQTRVRALVQLGRWDEASTALDRFLNQSDTPDKTRPGAPSLYAGLSLTPQAIQELGKRRPKDGHLQMLLGRHWVNLRVWKEAIPAFTRAAELLPKEAYPWVALAHAHLQIADPSRPPMGPPRPGEPGPDVDQAARTFSKALDLLPPVPFPVTPPARPGEPIAPPQLPPTLYSEIVGRSMASPQTRGLFSAVAELRPSDGRLWLEYCYALSRFPGGPGLVASKELRNALDELVKRAPKEPLAWIERGAFLAKEGEFEKAAEDYARAAPLLPRMPPFHPTAGRMYFDIVDRPKLFEAFTARAKNDPYHWYFRGFRRSTNVTAPDHGEWEKDMRQAVACRPEEEFFRSALRTSLLSLGQWERAAAEGVAEMKRQEPRVGAAVWLETAAAHAAAGQKEQYRALCQRMEKVWGTPEKPAEGQQLAWAAGLRPDSGVKLEKMLELAQAALRADSVLGINTFTAALIQYRLGQFSQTVSLIRSYQSTPPGRNSLTQEDRILLNVLLALALARDGKQKEARPIFEGACRTADGLLMRNGKRQRTWPGTTWAAITLLRAEAEDLLKAEQTPEK